MDATMETRRSATPAHLWIVGALALLWTGFGCFDYIMTNLRDPGYLAQFPPEMIQMIDAFPVWATAAWAIGVWGALAGSILLLLRSRLAVAAYAVSLAGLAATTLYQVITPMPDSMREAGNAGMTVVIWIIAIALLVYATRMRRRGVLR